MICRPTSGGFKCHSPDRSRKRPTTVSKVNGDRRCLKGKGQNVDRLLQLARRRLSLRAAILERDGRLVVLEAGIEVADQDSKLWLCRIRR
jgi:hypothetical protein